MHLTDDLSSLLPFNHGWKATLVVTIIHFLYSYLYSVDVDCYKGGDDHEKHNDGHSGKAGDAQVLPQQCDREHNTKRVGPQIVDVPHELKDAESVHRHQITQLP